MASQWEQIKWIPGTRLMVDGFRYQNAGCKSYLLTHFHSDHTTGLTRSFNAGLVFCTTLTARLLRREMGLPSERIVELPMDKVTVIEGTEVTPICANHCPGACMLLFKVRETKDAKPQIILHTGDMRWDDSMAEHPALKGLTIDFLFMDTTYAKPTHTHPPQAHCIAMMADVMKAELARHPRTVFVCGSYHIGKERAYLGAAKLLGWKVWCDASKLRTLRMLDLPPELMACLASRPEHARIHVDFLGGLQPEKLQKKLDGGRWTHAVGFRPTGWTFRRSGKLDRRTEGAVTIYGIPYSEHSSWTELRSCVALLRPRRLVPTVNAANPNAARTIVNRFADLMDLSGDRTRLDFFIRKQLAAVKSEREATIPASSEPISVVKIEPRTAAPAATVSSSCFGKDRQAEEEGIEDSDDEALAKVDDRLLEAAPSTDSAISERCSSSPAAASPEGLIGAAHAPAKVPDANGDVRDVAERRRSPAKVADVDIADVDVAEQLRILDSIGSDRKRHDREVAECLAKKKQATLSSFFRR